MQNSVTKSLDTGTNYYAFFAFFVVGCLFFMLAFTFLPLILITPAKFNLFFSLGSLFMQLSLAFYHGPMNYLKILFKKENILISALYIGSVLLAVYTSLFWGTYISALAIIAL
jgi:hypothetical protein